MYIKLSDEIIENLLENGIDIYHYILITDEEKIKQRLINRGESENSWAVQQIDKCLQSFNEDIKGEKIDTNNLNLLEVVNIILEKSNMEL